MNKSQTASVSQDNGSTKSSAGDTDGSVRVKTLETACNLITGDRSQSYGNYRDQMVGIAMAFNGFYNGIEDAPFLEPRHVSMILMLLKLRRRVTSGDWDSSVDLCGYAALDAEFFTDPDKL